MRIIEPAFKIEDGLNTEANADAITKIANAARNCYKSEDKATRESDLALVKKLITSGHHAMIEFADVTIRFICDRGITHELVRHRIASFAQESTRYCNYSKDKFGKEITVIRPFGLLAGTNSIWEEAMVNAEDHYFELLADGVSPQWARSVLPNSLKTEIIVKASIREWRHIFTMRAINKFAHPQIRQIMIPAFLHMVKHIPVVFDDLLPENGFETQRPGVEFPMEHIAKEID